MIFLSHSLHANVIDISVITWSYSVMQLGL